MSTTSAHPTASTLRPRATKRLISGLDQGDDISFDQANSSSVRLASPAPSAFNSRPASPIPPAHPQRLSHGQRNAGAGLADSSNKAASVRVKTSSADSLAGLWGNSWSALQGIASEFLGNELATSDAEGKLRVRRAATKPHGSTSAPLPPRWGPTAPTSQPQLGDLGIGTREQQIADFRARRRKDMLIGQESSYADTLGKFKRRLSDDRNSVSAPPGDNEDRDALVYIHRVGTEDTLAGITIRYNISANVFRKANRMWPNDTVQARQNLILPVDACGVKGKLVSGPEVGADLLVSENESLSTLQAEEVPVRSSVTPVPNGSNANRYNRNRTNSASTHTTTSEITDSTTTEPIWQHDSWVLLPNDTRPTEIVRLPRRALGYFPPARRKSNCLSDLDTPSTSLDLARTNTSDARSPVRQSPPHGRAGGRRSSNATHGYFPTFLSGPGGVGSMSKSIHHPGPGPDGLNTLFAKHLPDVAPPRNQNSLYQPELPLYTDEPTPVGSGSGTPAFPHSGPGNLNLNLENVGGAIESWVRRLATKATQTPQGRQQAARASVGAPGKGAGGVGDLIEMTDEFEIGGDEEDEGDRGRQSYAFRVQVDGPSSTATSYSRDATTTTARDRGASGKSGKAD